MKILFLNGPNLNLLGTREPDKYGSQTLADIEKFVRAEAEQYGIAIEFYQSNIEGELVNKIQEAKGVFDGIVINPAAYTHTSVAILDALKSVGLPTVEVHITDINSREEFRKRSYISLYAEKMICGKGFDGYLEAIVYLKNKNIV